MTTDTGGAAPEPQAVIAPLTGAAIFLVVVLTPGGDVPACGNRVHDLLEIVVAVALDVVGPVQRRVGRAAVPPGPVVDVRRVLPARWCPSRPSWSRTCCARGPRRSTWRRTRSGRWLALSACPGRRTAGLRLLLRRAERGQVSRVGGGGRHERPAAGLRQGGRLGPGRGERVAVVGRLLVALVFPVTREPVPVSFIECRYGGTTVSRRAMPVLSGVQPPAQPCMITHVSRGKSSAGHVETGAEPGAWPCQGRRATPQYSQREPSLSAIAGSSASQSPT